MPGTIPYSDDIQIHLTRLAIDETAIEHARAAWLLVKPRLPRLIEEFYEHLLRTGSGPHFEDVDLTRLKVGQFAYWRSLFCGNFDEAYRTHVMHISERHRRAGIDLALYISAYAWFSEHLFRAIARVPPPPPITTHDVFIATNKIIYLDLILAAKGSGTALVD